MAVSNPGPIYVSTNSGTAWTLTDAPTNNNWASTASSADGNKLIAVASSTKAIYTSAGSGTNWVQQTNTFTDPIFPFSIASSADGDTLVVVAYNVHYSTNSGTNWTQTVAPLTVSTGAILPSQVIASSADGAKWVVAETFSETSNKSRPDLHHDELGQQLDINQRAKQLLGISGMFGGWKQNSGGKFFTNRYFYY